MGKFAMECPHCGNYVTAYNGLRGLVQKKITCSGCGTEIDVRTERMTSVKCPHCENNVIYDQGKKTPRCPVCGNEIAPSTGQKFIKFKCPECGVGLTASEGTGKEPYICPICDCKIDVQREAAKEKYAREGLASIIKYEGNNSTFIWKHPIEDFNTGSQLIVHESQEAVFFRDGQALDVFGAGRYTLETQNLPLMNQLYKLPTGDTKATFHTEVYFVNLATQMGIKWGTDTKVRVFDPISGMHVSIGASGEFNIRVVDSKRILLKLVGTTNGLIMEPSLDAQEGDAAEQKKYDSALSKMTGYFRALIMTKVKSYLAGVIRQEAISILEIDEHMEALSEALCRKINEGLVEYGLSMPEFYIVRFVTPEDDESDPSHDAYMKMKGLYGAQFIAMQEKSKAEAERGRILVEAETAAQRKLIGAQAEAEAYRMKAAAEAEEMRMKGYSYQEETARQVGMEAMKHGLTGGETGGSALGDLAGLGVSLGAMGSIIGMTKDTFQGVASLGTIPTPQVAQTPSSQPVAAPEPTVPQAAQTPPSQPAAEDPVATLKQLKAMLDNQLIPQALYDEKVKEVLSRM
ncbi:MAG: SPFH domain-containing protein [Clostridiales bacterium]|nr:SPFH domain-containing protein [Clostridiales bacterium]